MLNRRDLFTVVAGTALGSLLPSKPKQAAAAAPVAVPAVASPPSAEFLSGKLGETYVMPKVSVYQELIARLEAAGIDVSENRVVNCLRFSKAYLQFDLPWDVRDRQFYDDEPRDDVTAILCEGQLTLRADGRGRVEFDRIWGPKHGMQRLLDKANRPGRENWDGELKHSYTTGVLFLMSEHDENFCRTQRLDVPEFELRDMHLVIDPGFQPLYTPAGSDEEFSAARATRVTGKNSFFSFQSHVEHDPNSDYEFGETAEEKAAHVWIDWQDIYEHETLPVSLAIAESEIDRRVQRGETWTHASSCVYAIVEAAALHQAKTVSALRRIAYNKV